MTVLLVNGHPGDHRLEQIVGVPQEEHNGVEIFRLRPVFVGQKVTLFPKYGE